MPPNPRAKGGLITMTPGWEGLLLPQILEEMDDLGEKAMDWAEALAPVRKGYTDWSIRYQVDPEDGSMYLNAGGVGTDSEVVWDAYYSEFGTGSRGAATGGEIEGLGADTAYGGVVGRAAQPFIRPGALQALDEKFGPA